VCILLVLITQLYHNARLKNVKFFEGYLEFFAAFKMFCLFISRFLAEAWWRNIELSHDKNDISAPYQPSLPFPTRRTLSKQILFNPLKPELNSICYLLALLAHHFLHVSRIRVKSLTFRRLMSYIYIYIYGAPILDVSRSHTTTQHSR